MSQDNEELLQWPEDWMDSLPSAIILVRDGQAVRANRHAAFLFGWKQGLPEQVDWINGGWLTWREEDLTYLDVRWTCVPVVDRQVLRLELMASRAAGEPFHVELRLSPGPGVTDIVQIVDISEARFRQQALQDREAHYRRLNDIAQEAIVQIKDGVVLDVNSRFLAMLGVEHPEEVIGDPVGQLGLRRIGNLEPIEGSGVFDRGDWMLQNRNGEMLNLDIGKGRLEDGSEVWMMYDISDRKRIEYDLIQERERFRLLVQSSPNGILILVDDLIRYANPVAESLFKGDADVLEGVRFETMFPEEHRKRALFSSSEARQGRDVEEWERFRLLVQSSPNGILILVDDLIRYANPVAESLFKGDADVLEGVRFETMFPEEHRKRALFSSSEARQGRDVEEWEVELPGNGKRITFKWRLTIFDGQPAVQVNLSDVTDRHSLMQERIRAELAEEANQQLTQQIEQRIAAEAALKSATARMRSIVESGEDFIIWTATSGHQVTSANRNFVMWLGGDASDDVAHDTWSAGLGQLVAQSQEWNGFDLEDRFDRALKGRPQRFEWAIGPEQEGGERRWLQLFLNPIELVEGTPEISAIAYDITERKRIDKAIRGALKEKEILLQEVHHRVKNNLQIINSILNLQKSFVNDDKAIEGLEEIQNRVSTMSIIHETLYQNTDVSSIGFPSYMERIAGNIIQGYQSRTRVELVTDLEDIQAPLDQAIPCGLILNEWVSNAMKYAFEGRENGTITVGLRAVEVEGQAEEEEIQIEVRDDGVGLPEGFDWSGKDSLGLYLVQALSEQLDAELLAESDGGTRFLVRFRRPKNLFDG